MFRGALKKDPSQNFLDPPTYLAEKTVYVAETCWLPMVGVYV
jgi:hypothetical protein